MGNAEYMGLFHSFAFILGKSVEGSVGQVLLQFYQPDS